MRTAIAHTEANAVRYAGWYATEDAGNDPLTCEMCGSCEDVTFSGPDGDIPLCLDCTERPSRLWDPYYDAVYGAEVE